MSGETFTHIGVHVADHWDVRCSTYPDRLPILVLRAESTTVDLSVRDQRIDGNAVQFARLLAEQAALFAAEVERLHAERLATASGVCSGCGGPAMNAA